MKKILSMMVALVMVVITFAVPCTAFANGEITAGDITFYMKNSEGVEYAITGYDYANLGTGVNDGKVKAKVTITNGTSAAATPMFILAVKDTNGILTDVDVAGTELAVSASDIYEANVTVTDKTQKVSAYVWNGSNIKPVSKVELPQISSAAAITSMTVEEGHYKADGSADSSNTEKYTVTGKIDNATNTVRLEVEYKSDTSKLKYAPTIAISEGASISHITSSVTNDMTFDDERPQKYVVTAANGLQETWWAYSIMTDGGYGYAENYGFENIDLNENPANVTLSTISSISPTVSNGNAIISNNTTKGLVYAYHYGSGNRRLIFSSGNMGSAGHATVVNSPKTDDEHGKVLMLQDTSTIYSDGTVDETIRIASNNTNGDKIFIGRPATVEFDIMIDESSEEAGTFGVGIDNNNTGQRGLWFVITKKDANGKYYFGYRTDSDENGNISTGKEMVPGKWYRVALTYVSPNCTKTEWLKNFGPGARVAIAVDGEDLNIPANAYYGSTFSTENAPAGNTQTIHFNSASWSNGKVYIDNISVMSH